MCIALTFSSLPLRHCHTDIRLYRERSQRKLEKDSSHGRETEEKRKSLSPGLETEEKQKSLSPGRETEDKRKSLSPGRDGDIEKANRTLKAELLADENDLDAVRNGGFARDHGLTADAVRRQAVGTAPELRAGRLLAETDRVRRSSHIADAGEAALDVRHDLIHPGDDDDVFRACNQTRDAVAVAVDIDELAVQGDRVGAHEKIVRSDGIRVHGGSFLRRDRGAPVVQDIVRFFELVDQSDFGERHGAAEGDGAARREKALCHGKCLFLIIAVIALNAAQIEFFNQAVGKIFIILLFRRHGNLLELF